MVEGDRGVYAGVVPRKDLRRNVCILLNRGLALLLFFSNLAGCFEPDGQPAAADPSPASPCLDEGPRHWTLGAQAVLQRRSRGSGKYSTAWS